jgi:hypothetical protein
VSIPTCRREERSVTFYSNDRYLNGYTNEGNCWEAGLAEKDRVNKYGQTVGLTREIGYSLITDTRK